jgi:hypothetical protein
MMYPLHALNLNMLNVQGRSDLFLRLEIIKKILAIPVIITGIVFGIKPMIFGMMVNTQIAYVLNSYWSGHFIDYPIREQVQDILPSFILAVVMGIVVAVIGWLIPFGYPATLTIQLVSGAALVFLIAEITKLDAYLFLKEILYTKFVINQHAERIKPYEKS